MTSDFHPRLAAVIGDKKAATDLLRQQIDVAISLCTPVLLLLLGLAPWVIRLLYTAEFAPATSILRWQLLGDILKVVSFPLGFVLLASGKGLTFMLAEMLTMFVFIATSWILLPHVGIEATGMAFLLMNALHLPLLWFLSKALIDFELLRPLKRQFLTLSLSAIAVFGLTMWSESAAAVVAAILAIGTAHLAFKHLKQRMTIANEG